MNHLDMDAISDIVAKYGYVEWVLVGFTPARDYTIFSYFTDPSALPAFRAVLLSMLRMVESSLERGINESYVKSAGTC
ncbi:MAG: hypothetical protein L6290_12405 [Thermodesulfovibrionales bacterium]|nr:hypothetical protein [Thermodesulfovibrionales bacterium]